MVEVLTGVLAGGRFAGSMGNLYSDYEMTQDVGHFLLVVDLSRTHLGAGFAERTGALVAELKGSATADGFERIRMPGEVEAELAADRRGASGIALPDNVVADLDAIARKVGAAPLGDEGGGALRADAAAGSGGPPTIVFLDRDTLPPERAAAGLRQPGAARRARPHPPGRGGRSGSPMRTSSFTNKTPIGAAAIAGARRLRLVAVAATGYDPVDVEACRAAGIRVAKHPRLRDEHAPRAHLRADPGPSPLPRALCALG